MDYRDFKEKKPGDKKPKPKGKSGKESGFWWARPKRDDNKDEPGPHQAVWDLKKHLEENQADRTVANSLNMNLYGDFSSLGISANSREAAMTGTQDRPRRLTLNVVRAGIDTVLSKTAKNRPKPTFVTSGGDFSLQQRAKKLDKFCQGQFYEADYYEVRRKVLLDALVFGTGIKKFWADHDSGTARVERTLPEELLIDAAEGFHGAPRMLLQHKAIAREILLGMYDGDAAAMAAIEEARGIQANIVGRGVGEQIEVVEAWHLPSHPKAKDGRHVIALENFTLDDEEWKRDEFPFTFTRWANPLVGFWGVGISEQLAGIQLEINKLLKKIQAIMELCSIPRYWLERGSKVDTKSITNAIGWIGFYSGTRPSIEVINAVPPEIFQQLDRLYNRAFESIGVSQLSASAQKPAGLNSGKALREYNDIESERFALFQQQDEATVLADGRQFIALARELEKYEVKAVSKRFLESIRWADVDLDEDKYVMQMFPTSSLPSHPAARMQTIQEWQDAGWVDATEARRLLDMPDLEGSSNVAFAAQEDIDSLVERILNEGEKAYEAPEPLQDLQYGLKRFQSAYLRAKVDKVPETTLELFREWIDAAQALLSPPPAPSAPGGAPPGAPPPAPPQLSAGAPVGPPQMPAAPMPQ